MLFLDHPLCAVLTRLVRIGGEIGDAVAVDPAISSGLPLPTVNRQPPPGSRPEKYFTPATKGINHHFHHRFPMDCYFFLLTNPHMHVRPASDPAQNPYWKRDVRRAYPQLSVVTQSELSTLLIQHSGAAAAAESVKPLTHPPHPRFRFYSVAVRFYSSRLSIPAGLQRH